MKFQSSMLQAIDDIADRSHSLREAMQRVHDFRASIEGLQFNLIPPESLVGRPCTVSAPEWHLAQLLNAKATDSVRLEYHARWLAYLLEPDNPARYPLTSIIIPVYNRRELVAEAIQSCFEQNSNIEVIVIDDGSTDGLEESLQPIRERIVFHRKPNGGVSSARNAGLRLAKGMFVRFLDSDDLLYPECTNLTINAFAVIPDADVCFSLAQEYDPRGQGPASRFWVPDGGPFCPTTDLMRAPFPAYMIATTLSRWFTLSLPPFDESMLAWEDVRYWYHIARFGGKAISLTEPLVERRQTPGNLSTAIREQSLFDEIVVMASAIDTLLSVDHWPYLLEMMLRLESRNRWMRIETRNDAGIPRLRADFLEAIRSLPAVAISASVSELPALISLLAALCRLESHGHISEEAKTGFYSDARQAIGEGLCDAPPVSASDIVLWMSVPPPRPHLVGALSLATDAPEIKDDYNKCMDCIAFLEHWATGNPEGTNDVASIGRLRRIRTRASHFIASLYRKERYTEEDRFLDRIIGVVGYPDAQALLKDDAMTKMLEPLTSSHPSVRHHFELLKALANEPPRYSVFIPRYLDAIHYHARWLAYFITPQRLQNLPNVIVTFQLPDTPGELHRLALESILAQTYHAVDAVVVADLGQEAVQEFFAGFEGRVSGLHRGRQNLAAAFNLAITKYYAAELSVLLDPVSVVEPDFVKNQIRAFADDPVREVIVTPTSVMISRNMIHCARMMDEWLSTHALARYLFRLGLAGAPEAVEACFARLNDAALLAADEKAHHAEIAAVVLQNLVDSTENMALWNFILDNWRVLSIPKVFQAVAAGGDKYVRRAHADFLKSSASKTDPGSLVPLIFNLTGVALARISLSSRGDLIPALQEIESRLLEAAERNGELEAEDGNWILKHRTRSDPVLKQALASVPNHLPRGKCHIAVKQGLELFKL